MTGARITITKKTKNIVPELEKQMLSAMRLSITHLENEVKKKTPINFGVLRNSITSRVIIPKHGEVFAQLPGRGYVDYVEFGRKPGKMPPHGAGSALRLWVRRKLKLSGSALESASFLIARAIGKRKIEGIAMFRNTEEQEKHKARKIFRDFIKKAERRSSDG